jgi:hypothetical protein
MEEIDIWRAANRMIDLYGAEAALNAALRSDKMLDQGNVDGFHTWKRVVDAIRDLERQAPTPSDPIN